MKSYKEPSFQDRAGRAAEAKQKALEQFRAKPPMDEKIMADRQAARLKRESAKAERRAARKAEDDAGDETKTAQTAKIEAAPPPPTEEERKRARDARYAARKSRR